MRLILGNSFVGISKRRYGDFGFSFDVMGIVLIGLRVFLWKHTFASSATLSLLGISLGIERGGEG